MPWKPVPAPFSLPPFHPQSLPLSFSSPTKVSSLTSLIPGLLLTLFLLIRASPLPCSLPGSPLPSLPHWPSCSKVGKLEPLSTVSSLKSILFSLQSGFNTTNPHVRIQLALSTGRSGSTGPRCGLTTVTPGSRQQLSPSDET